MVAYRKDRHLTGSFKPGQHPPELVYSRPAPGELTAQQRELLAIRPKRLTPAEKLEFRRKVIEAPWLTAGDRDLLTLWCQARSRYEIASKAFGRLMRDPEFPKPGSVVAAAAIPLGRLQHREAMTMIGLAQRLGFSPMARRAMGVERRPDQADDVWSKLRLVRSEIADKAP